MPAEMLGDGRFKGTPSSERRGERTCIVPGSQACCPAPARPSHRKLPWSSLSWPLALSQSSVLPLPSTSPAASLAQAAITSCLGSRISLLLRAASAHLRPTCSCWDGTEGALLMSGKMALLPASWGSLHLLFLLTVPSLPHTRIIFQGHNLGQVPTPNP